MTGRMLCCLLCCRRAVRAWRARLAERREREAREQAAREEQERLGWARLLGC